MPIAKRPLPLEDPKDRPPSIWSRAINSRIGQRTVKTWGAIPFWVKWLFAIGLLRQIARNIDWQEFVNNIQNKQIKVRN